MAEKYSEKLMEQRRKASKKYHDNNMETIAFKINKKTEADIVDKLNSLTEPKATYIKKLIRRDINEDNKS